jgi:AGZA family xanthine/uracil permease-like MFS transporter
MFREKDGSKDRGHAGITSFMTMGRYFFVNPAMISQTGMDFGAAMMLPARPPLLHNAMGLFANIL